MHWFFYNLWQNCYISSYFVWISFSIALVSCWVFGCYWPSKSASMSRWCIICGGDGALAGAAFSGAIPCGGASPSCALSNSLATLLPLSGMGPDKLLSTGGEDPLFSWDLWPGRRASSTMAIGSWRLGWADWSPPSWFCCACSFELAYYWYVPELFPLLAIAMLLCLFMSSSWWNSYLVSSNEEVTAMLVAIAYCNCCTIYWAPCS